VSDYGFGPEDDEPQTEAKEPAWFRSRMDKVSSEIAELKAENDRLKVEAAKQTVKDALTAKGYAPEAAGLYTGAPDKLDDWLSAHGAALVKAADAAVAGQGQAPQGPPASTVSAENQQAQVAFQAAGQGAAGAALSAEDQLVARLKAATTMEELAAIEREQGSRYVR
jgi:hypothetical protein